MFQAATAHLFHLPEDLALRAVTSVPARSLRIDHRVGYARPGYDADIVLWNAHPLSLGAAPLQVFVDGRPELDEDQVRASTADLTENMAQKPKFRPTMEPDAKATFCAKATDQDATLVITGIAKSYLTRDHASATVTNLTLVMRGGEIVCFGDISQCASAARGGTVIEVDDGYVLPGLTAASVALGMAEMNFDDSTGDGSVSTTSDPFDPDDVVYAKCGVHLEGKFFARARIGGVTKAISPPLGGGYIKGVSVGISTIDHLPRRGRGIFSDDVALHVQVSQAAKGKPRATLLAVEETASGCHHLSEAVPLTLHGDAS